MQILKQEECSGAYPSVQHLLIWQEPYMKVLLTVEYHCIVSMKKAGYDVKEIYACGGLAQSDFWMQMHADIIGVPMYTTVESLECRMSW